MPIDCFDSWACPLSYTGPSSLCPQQQTNKNKVKFDPLLHFFLDLRMLYFDAYNNIFANKIAQVAKL